MNYVPEVNDYVIWKPHIKGWVYYKDKNNEYITIEALVKPKNKQNILDSPLHANNRLLVLCYSRQWHELKYIKSRKSIYEK